VRIKSFRNLSGKVQVIDGRPFAPGELVPWEHARVPDGEGGWKVNPHLGPPPDTRARAKRDRGG
jgi:hypothetical protein